MLKLDVYNGRDLQNFLSLLNQCEGAGVTDIRFVRERLQRRLDESARALKASKYKKLKLPKTRPRNVLGECPSCGKKTLRSAKLFKGVACVCGYSKMDIVGE